jgi:hypothetical protein
VLRLSRLLSSVRLLSLGKGMVEVLLLVEDPVQVPAYMQSSQLLEEALVPVLA